MLTFVGDVYLPRPVRIDADVSPGPWVLNLEAPLTLRERRYPGKVNLRSDPAAFDATFVTPPLAVCLANNHVLDFFPEGLDDTLTHLARRGVAGFGAGTDVDRFRNPAMLEVDGVRIAMLGYADRSTSPVFAVGDVPGVAPLELARVREDIEAARRAGAERVVVQVHWGAEQVHLPSLEDVRLGRAIAEAGADLIVGHHAHCVQAHEVYRGTPIFYGLGNCIFPPHSSPSYFDEHGMPQRWKVSRSFPWNRVSLAVRWDPRSGATHVTFLHYQGGRLRRGRRPLAHRRVRIVDEEAYAARYRRAYAWGKLRHILATFLVDPKLPRWRHVRGLARGLRARSDA